MNQDSGRRFAFPPLARPLFPKNIDVCHVTESGNKAISLFEKMSPGSSIKSNAVKTVMYIKLKENPTNTVKLKHTTLIVMATHQRERVDQSQPRVSSPT